MDTVSFVTDLISRAHRSRASDIHIDPQAQAVEIRMRIDGVLHRCATLSNERHAELIAHLKIRASLRTDEHFAAQDGRFTFTASAVPPIDIRLSCMPTYYGENAVLRLFPLETEYQTLASLGMRREHVRSVTEVLANSSGLVLVVGPTGSGKTTTLYTLMELVRTASNSRTILTSIEDPVERPLSGIRQIPAGSHTGISFEQGLRAILRQDPDVIMVGELRDTETARLAIQAALTGHLVLSTLHALDIPTSIPRLTALGIDLHLLGSTLRILIAERLVRTPCDSCGIPRAFGNHPENQFPLAGIQISGDGCASCNMTGYQGRTGVFDIATNDHPSDGVPTAFERPSLLFREAFRKVVEGSTTCEEARRIEYA